MNQEYWTSKKDFDIDGIYGIKYVALSERHIQKNYKYIYALQGLAGKSVFEIGVGPGYQFYLLQQVLGCDMFGCDVLLDEQYVYRRLRTAIGIKELVEEQKIEYDSPIRIPEGSEAVVAFWTVFHKPWSIKEHKWILDSCAEKLVGKKMVALRHFAGG